MEPACPPLRKADDGSCIREVVSVVRYYPKFGWLEEGFEAFLLFLDVVVALFLDLGSHVGGEQSCKTTETKDPGH